MKNKIILLCLMLALTLVACTSSPKPGSPDASKAVKITQFTPTFTPPAVEASFYTNALKKLASKDTSAIDSIDMTLFRFSYLAYRKSIRLFSTEAIDKKLGKAMKVDNFNEIEKTADEVLSLDFTDATTHFIKSYAMKKNGKDPSFHDALYKSLMQSIFASGDGKTPATAYVLSQEKEEMAVLNHLKLVATTYVTASMSGHTLSIVECKNKEDENYSVYFDITEPKNFAF